MFHPKVQTPSQPTVNTNQQQQLLALLLVTPLTLASALPKTPRACAYTCGSHCYTSSEVAEAQNAGWELHVANQEISGYPHQYQNYENFDFPVPGEYFEYPIMASGQVYDGGSPGADRVVFNENDRLAGVITHYGAEGGAFVDCW